MPVGLVDQLTHLLHLVLGFSAAGLAVIALMASKGGRLHRYAGWAFVIAMTVAATTAWAFMISRPLPLAMVQATLTFYGLGIALLAINPHWRRAKPLEWGLFVLLIVVIGGMLATSLSLFRAGGPVPFVAPLFMATIFSVFAVLDWRYLRLERVSRLQRLRRHSLGMALTLSFTISAPLITFADDLGIPVPAIVFGSFLIIPLVYYAFGPQAGRAANAKVPAS